MSTHWPVDELAARRSSIVEVLLHPEHAGPRSQPVDLGVGQPGRESSEGLVEGPGRPDVTYGVTRRSDVPTRGYSVG
jgi:hypothetical protein